MAGHRPKSVAALLLLVVVVVALSPLAIAQDDTEPVAAPARPAANGADAAQPVPVSPVLPNQPVDAAVEAVDPATPAADAPAAADQGVRELSATIQAVKGNAQYRSNPDEAWKPAAAGVVVTQGAEFRTGLGARIDVLIEPDHMLTINRLGSVSLIETVQADGIVRTNVGMKYGRTNYRVEEGAAEHQSTIAAPGMTLAIRSTDTQVSFDPLYGGSVTVYNSPNSVVRNLNGPVVVMTNGTVDAGDLGAAQAALRRRALQMLHRYATTQDDQEMIERLPGFGDITRDADVTFRGTVIEQQREAMLSSQFDAERFSVGVIDPNLTFRVFDLGSPDGDTVNVLFNGQLLQSNLQLSELGTPFNVFLNQRENRLTLQATSFGSAGGVSAGVEVPDGGATFDFVFEQGGENSKTLDVIYLGTISSESSGF